MVENWRAGLKMFFGVIIYMVIFFALQWPWRIFATQHHYGLPLNPIDQVSSGGGVLANPANEMLIAKVLDYIVRFTIEPIWSLFLIFIFGGIYLILTRKNLYSFIIVASYIALVFLGTYIFAASYQGWEEIHGSLARLSMLFGPLLVFFASSIFFSPTSKSS
jgi:hypothetical protein